MKTVRLQYKDYHSHDSLLHTHYYTLLGLIAITFLSGLILTSSTTSATDDSIVDEINITVPVSCTLTGTGMNTHNANIINGTYQADIGSTTLKAFCNDNAGFAIYAAGYTGNEIGGTNSNKLVGTASSSNATIDTGTATSAGNPDTSNWAMKLTTPSSPTPTYPITLDNGFGSYSAVPNSYTKVAHRDSSTDIGTNAEGATLTTTYAAYISKTQVADTYSGQVIYTLVHPSDAEAPVIPKSLDTATTLQDVTYCSGELPEGQVYTLTDSRDGNIYHAARLADGNCWMLDNLALDPTDSTTAANMNESNTNATTAAINNLLNGGGSTIGWSFLAVTDVDTEFKSRTTPMINNASKDTLVTSYGPTSTNGQAKVGIYYNFCAASAGTYCYDSGQGIDVPETLIDASQDLCPVNWRMPTGGDNGEYEALAQKYDSDAANTDSLQYNLSTTLSGYYDGDNTYNQGYIGNWWSSTSGGGHLMYSLLVGSSYLDSAFLFDEDYGNYDGFTMRCLVGE